MKLGTYLEKMKMTDAAFAKRIGLTIHAIRKYRSGKRIPRPPNMLKIKRVSKGEVAEADWYS